MQREIIPFTTEEDWLANRVHDLTSSDVPCLFGVGYQTYEKLIHNKRNVLSPEIEETEEMRWGNDLQQSIAERFAKDNGWTIRRKDEYIRIPSLRLASSFDYEILSKKGESYIVEGLLEIKNVNEWKYKKDWKQGFEIEATPYIELQLQNELLVSGLNIGYIGALIGGCKGVLLKRTANPKIQDAILKKAAEFWRRIDESI